MPFKTIHENICCREVLKTEIEEPTCSGQLDAVEGLKAKLKDCKRCIVQHPSFEKDVLDEETLSAKIKETRAGEKRRRICEDQNMVFRYYAYRSFILWAYGRMGMREPFELPACVRAAIMSKFSLDGEKPSTPKGRKRVKKEVPKKEALECDEEEWREESI
ncbi:hypothetical protein TELCIR_03226 [Teladorsagia circumcincta]|uniref:P2X purinoreceptor 7 intracellular domain-containing protein n=1 Tax=Teladorsagia circumcincta TaxID=45464 RepID=A0A2G9UZ28_TELCI|nr:hypothetical protein TELCIR_03226 [Teladorsagia circumcincta]